MTRRRTIFWWTAVTLLVCFVWASPASADAGSVQFRDDPSDRITSDFGSPYVDGEDRVIATLGDNFILDTNKSGATAIRVLALDFSECVASSACTNPFDFYLGEALVRTTGHPDLEGLDEGESTPANLQVFFSDPNGNDLQWFLRFNTDGEFCKN